MKAFVKVFVEGIGTTHSTRFVSIAEWWQVNASYNPPQKKLSKRHLRISAQVERTLCGISLPSHLLPQRGESDRFGKGHSDCKRCALAADLP